MITGDKNERIIYLDSLPKYDSGACKGKINWRQCIGCKVIGVYEGEKFIIKIIGYEILRKSYLTIVYDGKEFDISTGGFIRCRFGKILGKRTSEFKKEIGESIKDDKRDLIITGRERRKDDGGRVWKYYKCKCNKCGWTEGWIEEHKLIINNYGCSCCRRAVIISGINDISTTNPESVKFFKYPEETKKYSRGHDKNVAMICPDCGREKMLSPNNLFNYGLACPCGNGKKYPEKFLMNIFEQLKVEFEIEYCPKWEKLKNKRYDFYFKYNNENYICEVNGIQHYEKSFKECGGKTIKEEQENDRFKKRLALDNGIKEENYIVIDCRKSTLEWIKDNKDGILNSKLSELFDLSKIDWLKAEEFALKNLVKTVCEIKRENPEISILDIKKTINLGKCTIIRYLKRGTKLGWCNYDPKEETTRGLEKASEINRKTKSKPVEIFKEGVKLGEYPSCQELARCSFKDFGIKLISTNIGRVCRGERKHHKGFTFKYVGE